MTSLRPVALLLDADGNLFPSEEPAFVASAVVTDEFLAELGLDVRFTPEQLRLATTGRNFRTTAVDLAVAHGVPVEAELVGDRTGARVGPGGLTAARLEHWVAREKADVTRHLGEVLAPDPDVLGPVTRLVARYRSCVVSSSASARLTACFTATGLAPLLPAEVRWSAEDSLPVPTSKPDPAVYLYACAQLGIEPGSGLAVEDSLPGATSAVRAGIPTVGNLQFVAPAERAEREAQLRAAGVTAVVTSWAEVEEMLGERSPA